MHHSNNESISIPVLIRSLLIASCYLVIGLTGCRGVPVTLHVEGNGLAVTDMALLAVAYGSPEGGRYEWELLMPQDGHRIIASRDNWVMVISEKAGAPVYRVTYKRRGYQAVGYFVPYVIGDITMMAGSWQPDTPKEIEDRKRRKRQKEEYIARMKSPEGIEDLRRAIRIAYLGSSEEPEPYTKERYGLGATTDSGETAAAVNSVGPAAAREIHRMLAPAGPTRIKMISAVMGIDPDYGLATVLPEMIAAQDIEGIEMTLTGMWPPFAPKKDVSEQALAGLRLASSHREPYIRISVYKCIGTNMIALAKEIALSAAQNDPHPQVREFAKVAAEAISPKPRGLAGIFSAKKSQPKWPELSGLLFTPTDPDPKDVKKARKLYPKVRREIETKLEFKYDLPYGPKLRVTQFQLYGWAVMPIVEERLAAENCSAKEQKALRLMKHALRTEKKLNSPDPRH